jgi:hypothetical protein
VPLEERVTEIGATPKELFERFVAVHEQQPIPAVWHDGMAAELPPEEMREDVWIPPADFDEATGIGGVDLGSADFGRFMLHTSVVPSVDKVSGYLEVRTFQDFQDRLLETYPTLAWCVGPECW